MKILIVTDDGREHESEIAAEDFCHSDIVTARKNSFNPAEAAAALASAGSISIRDKKINPERNDILNAILQNG